MDEWDGWVAEKGEGWDFVGYVLCLCMGRGCVACTCFVYQREVYIYIYIHTSPTGWPIRNIILNTGGLCTYPTYLPSYSTSADDT